MFRLFLRRVLAPACLVVLFSPAPAVLAADSFSLLTDDETAAFETFEASGQEFATRSLTLAANAGPKIAVSAPTGFTLKSPVNFDININPKDGIPVAMNTLRVEYRIGPLWTDVTRRLAGHGSVSGTRLLANGADLPKGKHQIRVTVQDQQKRVTQIVVKFSVVN